MSKILVIGATGVIGKVLVDAILNAREQFDTIGIFTSEATIKNKKDLIDSFKSRGAVIRTGDVYNDDDVLNVFEGEWPLTRHYMALWHYYDTVVSAVGRFAIDKQVDLIALAERSPTIQRFIPSEYGTDIAFDASSASEKPHQKKLKVRAYLESDAVQRLKYSYLVTGPFADLFAGYMAAEPRVGNFDLEKKEAILAGDGHGPVGMTTVSDVGRALVAVLKHPEATENKAVLVHSFVATPDELLKEYERQTGRPWTVSYTSMDELKKIEEDAWAAEHPVASIFTLRRIWAEGKTLYEKTDNEAIGLTKTDTLEMVIQANIASPQAAFQSGKL
ncbi:hypothetical protein SBRCBS47491_008507 [Sporothrix bragantina]|uniref:NmrA-like domain-containing protein n=1 Tax=Sporothrix bragantina TaxID=671064 RepID=A0ABP0CM20_9PEZI